MYLIRWLLCNAWITTKVRSTIRRIDVELVIDKWEKKKKIPKKLKHAFQRHTYTHTHARNQFDTYIYIQSKHSTVYRKIYQLTVSIPRALKCNFFFVFLFSVKMRGINMQKMLVMSAFVSAKWSLEFYRFFFFEKWNFFETFEKICDYILGVNVFRVIPLCVVSCLLLKSEKNISPEKNWLKTVGNGNSESHTSDATVLLLSVTKHLYFEELNLNKTLAMSWSSFVSTKCAPKW